MIKAIRYCVGITLIIIFLGFAILAIFLPEDKAWVDCSDEKDLYRYVYSGWKVEKVIKDYPDHGILTYEADYVNMANNNVFVPVDNIMSMFETYVYTKDTFDPAPRIFQECKYYNKDVIYLRDKKMNDGGNVYWDRKPSEPDIKPILESLGR